MKIKLEFEKDDFEKMFEQYFQDTGWRVLNLVAVVERFAQSFPDGITVEAEVAPQPARVDEPDSLLSYNEGDLQEEPVEIEDENPRLPAAKLTGPQDDDPDDYNEISHLLKESERYKS